MDEKRKALFEHEAKDLISLLGLPTTNYRFAKDKEEAIKAANEIGYPIALKIVSPQVIHKSDAGGVALGIDVDDELSASYKKIIESVKAKVPGAEIRGVLVEEMASPSVEVIVGATRESGAVFGVGPVDNRPCAHQCPVQVLPADAHDLGMLDLPVNGGRTALADTHRAVYQADQQGGDTDRHQHLDQREAV